MKRRMVVGVVLGLLAILATANQEASGRVRVHPRDLGAGAEEGL